MVVQQHNATFLNALATTRRVGQDHEFNTKSTTHARDEVNLMGTPTLITTPTRTGSRSKPFHKAAKDNSRSTARQQTNP
jgi:hypothetical protein